MTSKFLCPVFFPGGRSEPVLLRVFRIFVSLVNIHLCSNCLNLRFSDVVCSLCEEKVLDFNFLIFIISGNIIENDRTVTVKRNLKGCLDYELSGWEKAN